MNIQKINYQKELEKNINDIKKLDYTPSLLLHSCCAPCSSYVLEYLSNYFNITIYFYNPNITETIEYKKRVKEQQDIVNIMNKTALNKIYFLESDYNKANFFATIKGFENTIEGGEGCFKCYNLRIKSTALMAKKLKFDYFTTTLSISPLKNCLKINEIGTELEKLTKIKYLKSDFKKKNGYKRSIVLSKIHNLYRQNYCGCIYSQTKKEL